MKPHNPRFPSNNSNTNNHGATAADGTGLAPSVHLEKGGDFKLTMWIPAELGGKVIGVKGIIISNLIHETQCRFIKALQPVGDSLWVAVVMMGEPERCLSAYNAIAKLVFNEVDDIVLEFPHNRKKYGFLSGQQGFQIIKRISAETQVGTLCWYSIPHHLAVIAIRHNHTPQSSL